MFFKNGGIVWNPERSPRNLSIRDLFCSEEANPNSPRIFCGERSENLSLGRFLWRKPEKKTSTSIQLRRSIHPSQGRVKGNRAKTRRNLNPGLKDGAFGDLQVRGGRRNRVCRDDNGRSGAPRLAKSERTNRHTYAELADSRAPPEVV